MSAVRTTIRPNISFPFPPSSHLHSTTTSPPLDSSPESSRIFENPHLLKHAPPPPHLCLPPPPPSPPPTPRHPTPPQNPNLAPSLVAACGIGGGCGWAAGSAVGAGGRAAEREPGAAAGAGGGGDVGGGAVAGGVQGGASGRCAAVVVPQHPVGPAAVLGAAGPVRSLPRALSRGHAPRLRPQARPQPPRRVHGHRHHHYDPTPTAPHVIWSSWYAMGWRWLVC